MVEQLEQDIKQFNQDVLLQELTSALIIEHQLQALTNDLFNKNSSPQAKSLQNKILLAAQESIKGMLYAESQEVFLLEQKRFNVLISNLKEKLALDGDLQGVLSDYRFFHQLQDLLRETTAENHKDLTKSLPAWFKEHPHYVNWQEELQFLEQEKNPRIFETHRKMLLDDLATQDPYQDFANLTALSLIEQNSRVLSDTRLSYLKSTDGRKKLLKDVAWLGLGAALIVTASVLSIAFPPLIIPGIIIGSAVIGYGTIDFANQSASLYADLQTSLGEREVSPATKQEIENLQKTLNHTSKNHFLERQQHYEKEWSDEAKLIKGAGYGASFLGLSLGIMALVLVFPALGVPLAAVAVVAALSLAAIALAGGILGLKVYREQKHQQQIQTQLENKITSDENLVNEIEQLENEHLPESNASSLLHQHEKLNHAGMFNKAEAGALQTERVHPTKSEQSVEKQETSSKELKRKFKEATEDDSEGESEIDSSKENDSEDSDSQVSP